VTHSALFHRRSLTSALVLLALACTTTSAPAAETSLGAGLGATAGFGVQLDLTFEHFTRDLPLSLRLSGAYSGRNPGDAWDARRVFINDNTNGTPEEKGRTWQVRLDLLFHLTRIGPVPVHLGVGARRASFTGTFDFVGGNEKFDVKSDPWGAGVLLEAPLAISDRVDFALQLGVDHYFDAKLEGHDTIYAPDGDHVNDREDYGYEDADDAVDQPGWEVLGLVGVRIRLGG